MTKKRAAKRALISSLLALVLCLSMLMGTTLAWFTDSVASANNIIKSGNLDIELYYKNDVQKSYDPVTASTNIFKTETLWEPGHTEVVKLKVANVGSLALKYQLGINIVSETGSVNMEGKEFRVSDYIKFAIIEGDQNYTREEAVAAAEAANAQFIKSGYSSDITKLTATKSKEVTVVVYMPETVGNEANHGYGADQPVINLGLNLSATQVEEEFDSFGNQYDAGAQLPIKTESASTWQEVVDLAAEGAHIVLKNDISGDTTINMNGGSIDGNGHTMTFTGSGSGAVVLNPTGGTIKNVKIVNPNANMFDNQWAIGSMQMLDTTLTDDLYIENVDISGFNLVLDMKADGHSIYVKNSEITNWIQVNGAEEVSFEGCHFKADGAAQMEFNKPASIQGIIFLMGDMSFTNCHFEENVNFYLDSTRFSGTVHFNNSTYGNNGVENRPIDNFGFIQYWFPASGVYGYAGTFGETKPAQTHFNWYINGELVWDATAI